tara:strand:+ start:183 stop:509 length:327 start_codon:yes stop_codon:yes gene_type:complete
VGPHVVARVTSPEVGEECLPEGFNLIAVGVRNDCTIENVYIDDDAVADSCVMRHALSHFHYDDPGAARATSPRATAASTAAARTRVDLAGITDATGDRSTAAARTSRA